MLEYFTGTVLFLFFIIFLIRTRFDFGAAVGFCGKTAERNDGVQWNDVWMYGLLTDGLSRFETNIIFMLNKLVACETWHFFKLFIF